MSLRRRCSPIEPLDRGHGDPDRERSLGIETSCDETAAALVTHDGEIRANVVASQAELHARFGGVVPEIASRRHLELVSPVIREALDEAGATLDDVDTVAVTAGPGLIGALLVGSPRRRRSRGRARLPLVPVDHLHGHVASLYLQPLDLEPPFTCLLASGGHTLLLDVRDRAWEGVRVLGTTLDDAAGEAFDKGARLLGLPLPGRRRARPARARGRSRRRTRSRSRASRGSTSRSPGSRRRCSTRCATCAPAELEARRADLAASYQRAIVRALVERIEAAGAERVAIVGGVAANSELRASLPEAVAAPLAALHRQRRDDRLGRPLHRAPSRRREYLALDAYATAS